jgi:hypothetical protein
MVADAEKIYPVGAILILLFHKNEQGDDFMRGILVSLLGLVLMAGSSAATFAYLNPNGNGLYSQWENVGCLSTSEYQCVDDGVVWPDISDYLYTSAASKKETFAFENLGACSAVESVMLSYFARNYDSSHNVMHPMLRISGGDYLGGAINMSTSYQWYNRYFFTNPATGLAWTCAEVNNLEAGMKSSDYAVAGGRVANMYARVSYT